MKTYCAEEEHGHGKRTSVWSYVCIVNRSVPDLVHDSLSLPDVFYGTTNLVKYTSYTRCLQLSLDLHYCAKQHYMICVQLQQFFIVRSLQPGTYPIPIPLSLH